MQRSHNTFVFSQHSAINSALWFCLGLLWMLAAGAVFHTSSITIFDSAWAQNPIVNSVENDSLRYTSVGWQDPSQWMPQLQQGSALNLGSVNPLIWAAMLVLAVGIAVMWLSSDDEVERIFKERLEKAEMIAKWESEQSSR